MDDMQFHQGTGYRLTANESKPLVVLIHGVGLNQDMWRPWRSILEPNFCLLTFDILGHGQSHNPAGNRDVVDFANQLHALLTHLRADRFALVGFSLGALIGQAFASLYSERLTHLVLLHSVYQRTEEQRKAVCERYQITREQGPMATVEIAIERWFSEPYRKANAGKMNQLRKVFSSHTGDGYLKAYALFCNADTAMKPHPLARIKCPTLVITGNEDVGSTPAMSKALARDLPDAELIINTAQRHMAVAEFPDLMANQVHSFLHK